MSCTSKHPNSGQLCQRLFLWDSELFDLSSASRLCARITCETSSAATDLCQPLYIWRYGLLCKNSAQTDTNWKHSRSKAVMEVTIYLDMRSHDKYIGSNLSSYCSLPVLFQFQGWLSEFWRNAQHLSAQTQESKHEQTDDSTRILPSQLSPEQLGYHANLWQMGCETPS